MWVVVCSLIAALLAGALAALLVKAVDAFFVGFARLMEDVSTQGPTTTSDLTSAEVTRIFVATAAVTLVLQLVSGAATLLLFRRSESVRAWPAIGQALLSWVTATCVLLLLSVGGGTVLALL